MTGEGGHGHPVDPERVAAARGNVIDTAEGERLAELFRLLGDPVRARVLYALNATDELCVGDIALSLELPESSVSYALRILRTAGAVHTRRAGRLVYYRVADGFMDRLLQVARAHPGGAGPA
ncbi:MAG: metalloregulator ArsR/SmtB family transcription factor [Actinomycetota bacterium]|nr:metalloregulator ArsR/SmtB family transcription factor [Actinomycetota bacterium]